MNDEEQTQAIYKALQLGYLSEQHDAVKQLIEAAVREARIDTARKARVLYRISPTGTSGPAEVGFETSLDKTIPYSEYVAGLQSHQPKGGSTS